MASSFELLAVFAVALLASVSLSKAATISHSLYVKNLTVNHLCEERVIYSANGTLPGPTISVHEGDTLLITVVNQIPHNITIHWHGIFQLLSGWSDGPEHVTQCPIKPGQNYTYRFTITGQEGTLWWHAHSAWLRATVHGALVIHPRLGKLAYPFNSYKLHNDIPIVLGEWWNADVIEVENQGLAVGGAPNVSDAYTINGKPGNSYNCSQNDMYTLTVEKGKRYMLRIVNAALNNQLFFKIAGHRMTVIAVDATYTTPYTTDVIVLSPGHTTDVILSADQAVGAYYMSVRPYASGGPGVPFANSTGRAALIYAGAPTSARLQAPPMPAFNDTPTAHRFYTNLTSLAFGPQWVPVPVKVDHSMFIAFGLGLDVCAANATCAGPFGQRLSSSMNNVSFVIPRGLSMLQAFSTGTSGVYTTDFPDNPPNPFNYTDSSLAFNRSLLFAPRATRVKRLKYDDVVEIVLQNTALIAMENHPIHLHGFNFHVLAQGFGNYNATRDRSKFNLFNPQSRNTIAVPVGGWAVIRFRANNPGIWLMHCHLDVHLPWGLGMAFEVQNGPTKSSTLPPPPKDLPQC